MATNAPIVRLDREALIALQLKALELALYQVADAYDRIMLTYPQYTKGQQDAIVLPEQGGQ